MVGKCAWYSVFGQEHNVGEVVQYSRTQKTLTTSRDCHRLPAEVSNGRVFGEALLHHFIINTSSAWRKTDVHWGMGC